MRVQKSSSLHIYKLRSRFTRGGLPYAILRYCVKVRTRMGLALMTCNRTRDRDARRIVNVDN